MSFYFADQSWPQLKEAIDKNTLIILPVGTTEEHGQHLPVSCDAMIARAYGDELGKACEEARKAKDEEELKEVYFRYPKLKNDKAFIGVINECKSKLAA
jgi:hypothetical protein